MEEKQIRDFVHRIVHNDILRKELISDPDSVIEREKISPRVERVLKRLAPHLCLGSDGPITESKFWGPPPNIE